MQYINIALCNIATVPEVAVPFFSQYNKRRLSVNFEALLCQDVFLTVLFLVYFRQKLFDKNGHHFEQRDLLLSRKIAVLQKFVLGFHARTCFLEERNYELKPSLFLHPIFVRRNVAHPLVRWLKVI